MSFADSILRLLDRRGLWHAHGHQEAEESASSEHSVGENAHGMSALPKPVPHGEPTRGVIARKFGLAGS